MNFQKKNPIYLLVIFTIASLVTFSSCGGDKEDETPKLDFATLMSGEYQGEIIVGGTISSTATVTQGSTADEIIFTEKLKTLDERDSTTSFVIELEDLNSIESIALRIPTQVVGQTTVAGIALSEEDTRGRQGYFFYQDEESGTKINQITFLITANNGNYYYDFKKVE